jgi:hypothetical protein
VERRISRGAAPPQHGTTCQRKRAFGIPRLREQGPWTSEHAEGEERDARLHSPCTPMLAR